MNKKIFVLGANPAWQKTLFFDCFEPGNVNRARKMETYPAGKGANVCRAAACFGHEETCLFQFAGGYNGNLLCTALEKSGIEHFTVKTRAETRCCLTCLDSYGMMTELIEPSYPVLENEAGEMLRLLKTNIRNCAIFVISGSLPDGSDSSLYAKAAAIAVGAGVPVIADIVSGVEAVLELQGTVILKVNRAEIQKITSADNLNTAMEIACKRWPNGIFAVTDGPDCAYMVTETTTVKYSVPALETIVSPLGAGDTAAAVLACSLVEGKGLNEAFARGLEAASANCLCEKAGCFKKEHLAKCRVSYECII